jgi:hypothetical protein
MRYAIRSLPKLAADYAQRLPMQRKGREQMIAI